MQGLYVPMAATLERVVQESPTVKTFVMRPKAPLDFEAGQFIELTVPGVGEAPFTPSSSPFDKEKLEVSVAGVGTVTRALHASAPGAMLGLRGPLGMPYPLHEYQGKEVFIVGGGIGIAPLRALMFALLHDAASYKRIYLRYGARSPSDIVYKSLLKEWARDPRIDFDCTVDVGDPAWTGNVGVVTTILKEIPVNFSNSVAVCCGPPIMIKFVVQRLLEAGFKPGQLYLSMELKMCCGVGLCGHCRIGNFYVCRDGPVFPYSRLVGVKDAFA